jgi:hypothetical protein
LFSNTALAHNLGWIRNWIMIYFGREGARREHYFGAV